MMPIVESFKRLMTSVAAMLHNRMELASIEIEEESLRIFSALLTSLLALFCGAMAVNLIVFLCILLFWESHRFAVIGVFIVLFAGACLFLVRRVRQNYAKKPGLLSATLEEIRKDIDSFKDVP
jgi:uncharacterized membrane protein YqjE